MVEAIVAFSKKQNIKTIAEFVENEKIFNIVCDLEIDYSQGYYFGKADILRSGRFNHESIYILITILYSYRYR